MLHRIDDGDRHYDAADQERAPADGASLDDNRMAVTTSTNSFLQPLSSLTDITIGAGTASKPQSSFDNDMLLVRRSKAGDTNAYRQLVERHERRVLSIIGRIMTSQHQQVDSRSLYDVDDVAQEVFVLAWKALPKFRGDSKFSTWLYRIATNRALKEWRRAKAHPGEGWIDELDDEIRIPLRFSATDEANPEKLIQFRAEGERLMSAVDTLPDKQRLVILLHYYEDYSCEEIAKILTCSIGTVWSRLHYACKRLRLAIDTWD